MPLEGPDHIRILQLLPGSNDDPLEIALSDVLIDDTEDTYEALSYVWGDPDQTEAIVCQGKHIFVTKNLCDALRQLRHAFKARFLWADAICINQADDFEKSDQIKQMGRVYTGAKEVVVFLGLDPHDNARYAFALIQAVAEDASDHIKNESFSYRISTSGRRYLLDTVRRHWDAASEMLGLPWFTRVWVLQEVGIAKDCTVWWGGRHGAILDLFVFLSSLSKGTDYSLLSWQDRGVMTVADETAFRMFSMFNVMFRSYTEVTSWTKHPMLEAIAADHASTTHTFIELLYAGSNFNATDPRDYVYAFLGHPAARLRNGELLTTPDYRKSVEQIHYETACVLLRLDSDSLLIFDHVDHRDRASIENPALPSWVPRWNTPRQTHALLKHANAYRAGMYASPDSLEAFTFHPQLDLTTRLLTVKGYIFDRIIWTASERVNYLETPLNPKMWLRNHQIPYIDQLFREVLDATKLSERQLEREFSETMSLGTFRQDEVLRKLNAYRDHIKRVIQSTHLGEETETVHASEDARNYEYPVGLTFNRSLVYTEGGRLGLGTSLQEHGDRCCIIFGLKTPFIIREQAGGRFRLVAACYVNGVMNGELMEQIQSGDLQEESITLV